MNLHIFPSCQHHHIYIYIPYLSWVNQRTGHVYSFAKHSEVLHYQVGKIMASESHPLGSPSLASPANKFQRIRVGILVDRVIGHPSLILEIQTEWLYTLIKYLISYLIS